MKSKSFGLFLVSFIIIVLTLLVATFWNALGLGTNKIPLAISITITFGISIAGLILGYYEFKKGNGAKYWIGLIGNVVVVIFFVLMIIYSFKR